MVKSFIIKMLASLTNKIIHSREFHTLRYSKSLSKLKNLGSNSKFPENFIIKNPCYITIGDNFSSLYNLRLEAWDEYMGKKFTPELKIGNNVSLNTDVHIGCINRVVIGDNVLMASRIYISDHSHGDINMESLLLPPVNRTLFSKGPVIIEDNVWIGEGVCILPGVRLGKNTIVGANSVVTKSFGPNSVIAGIPAKCIKII